MSSRSPEPAPPVTILLSTFNGARFLPEQLASIAEQTHDDWLLHVSDDGSDDDSAAIIESFAAGDDRVRVYQAESGQGPAAAYLRLLGTVDTPYFALCDQDDLWQPNRLSYTVGLLEAVRSESNAVERPWPAMVATDATLIDEAGELIAESALDQRRVPIEGVTFGQLLMLNAAIGNTITGTRELAELARAIADGRPVVMHDWWLALVAASRGTFVLDRTATVQFRRHQDATTHRLAGEWGLSALRSRTSARERTRAVFARCVEHARYLDADPGEPTDPLFAEQTKRLAHVDPAMVTMLDLVELWRLGVRMWPTKRHVALAAGVAPK
ncbi:MAG: glycosyltransferase [Acidimicrobiales bacterium]|nr:glycosyltransferase [Acidimicrobiales bacterium]